MWVRKQNLKNYALFLTTEGGIIWEQGAEEDICTWQTGSQRSWSKYHEEELHNFDSTENVIKLIKIKNY
jgi:hypothetical protein